MKDFRIFFQPIPDSGPKNRNLTVEDLKESEGTSRLNELKYVKKGNLETAKELEGLRIYKYSCEYFGQKPKSVEERPVYSASIDVWQPEEQSIAIVFDAPRKVARVGASLLSKLYFGDPFKIQPIDFEAAHFSELWSRVAEMGGTVSQIIANNVPMEGSNLKQIQLKGRGLEEIDAIENLLEQMDEREEEIKIRYMGFALKFPGQDIEFSFRIGEWGGGQIYAPSDFLPTEFLRLLDLFEDSLLSF